MAGAINIRKFQGKNHDNSKADFNCHTHVQLPASVTLLLPLPLPPPLLLVVILHCGQHLFWLLPSILTPPFCPLFCLAIVGDGGEGNKAIADILSSLGNWRGEQNNGRCLTIVRDDGEWNKGNVEREADSTLQP